MSLFCSICQSTSGLPDPATNPPIAPKIPLTITVIISIYLLYSYGIITEACTNSKGKEPAPRKAQALPRCRLAVGGSGDGHHNVKHLKVTVPAALHASPTRSDLTHDQALGLEVLLEELTEALLVLIRVAAVGANPAADRS